MSVEIVTMETVLDEDAASSTGLITTTMNLIDESVLPSSTVRNYNGSVKDNTNDTIEVTEFYSEHSESMSVFEAFMITEIIMTALELTISVLAAIKIPRWRRNYRNQMLMQLSLARFIKRIIYLLKFFEVQKNSPSTDINTILNITQTYIDFVIVVLVFFFIKHMYDSLIIVVVKISQDSLNKTSLCAWLLPVLITGVWTAIMVTKILDEWYVYLLICCLFRWPLIFMGTLFYITILYRVLSDKIRQFARSLTIVTFLMCLVTNFYLFSKDVIELWCLKYSYSTLLVSYLSGFLLNLLILCFYIILIILNFNHNTQSSRTYSLADGNKPS